jgi:hypothetical protein
MSQLIHVNRGEIPQFKELYPSDSIIRGCPICGGHILICGLNPETDAFLQLLDEQNDVICDRTINWQRYYTEFKP